MHVLVYPGGDPFTVSGTSEFGLGKAEYDSVLIHTPKDPHDDGH